MYSHCICVNHDGRLNLALTMFFKNDVCIQIHAKKLQLILTNNTFDTFPAHALGF